MEEERFVFISGVTEQVSARFGRGVEEGREDGRVDSVHERIPLGEKAASERQPRAVAYRRSCERRIASPRTRGE